MDSITIPADTLAALVAELAVAGENIEHARKQAQHSNVRESAAKADEAGKRIATVRLDLKQYLPPEPEAEDEQGEGEAEEESEPAPEPPKKPSAKKGGKK